MAYSLEFADLIRKLESKRNFEKIEGRFAITKDGKGPVTIELLFDEKKRGICAIFVSTESVSDMIHFKIECLECGYVGPVSWSVPTRGTPLGDETQPLPACPKYKKANFRRL